MDSTYTRAPLTRRILGAAEARLGRVVLVGLRHERSVRAGRARRDAFAVQLVASSGAELGELLAAARGLEQSAEAAAWVRAVLALSQLSKIHHSQ